MASSTRTPPAARRQQRFSSLGEAGAGSIGTPAYRDRDDASSSPQRFHSPKRLFLIRHGRSEGNEDESVYTHTPDNSVHLSPRGWQQAAAAGTRVRDWIRFDGPNAAAAEAPAAADDPPVRFICSPYVRTLETFKGVASAWPGGPANPHLHVSEDPRIREMDFGNFQQRHMTARAKRERALFGEFWYRFPDGESCADVFDRVSLFLESLHREWDEPGRPENFALVTHGITIQVFLMRWFKYSVDEYARYKNPGNCEVCVLERDDATDTLQFSAIMDAKGEVRDTRRTWPTHELRKVRDGPPA